METMPSSSDSAPGISAYLTEDCGSQTRAPLDSAAENAGGQHSGQNPGQNGDGHRPPLQGGVEEKIWGQLRECYDPEIPLNIVDLGLVYGVSVKGNQANVQMTLTSPGCHLGGQIAGNVQERLLALAEIEEANVELVWDPPWHQSMISAEGRKALGLEAS
jgi:metal-sulfur cluster biosynthetic enzyme